ncbi:MAG: DUF2284 domain-containing protein, partial [Syntrophorhabdaceae bacterium]|nr:DUF2284 domain-containing protein [Syntrophorhabdaceae bacterium]
MVEKFNQYKDKAIEDGADNAIVIKTWDIFTAPWVRMKCQFGCPNYGMSLCCPPHTPTPEETRKILDSYTYALLIHRHWK